MVDTQKITLKDLAEDKGLKSRRFWLFIVTLAVVVPLATLNLLSIAEVALIFSLYLVYCIFNITVKVAILRRDLQSLPASQDTEEDISPSVSSSIEESNTLPDTMASEIEDLKRENQRLKDQLALRAELAEIKPQHEMWREEVFSRAKIHELERENQRLKDQLSQREAKSDPTRTEYL